MKRYLGCLGTFFAASVVGCVLAACVVGCGGRSGPERAVVSGSVTYDGRPVEDGTIRFVPDEATKAPASGALIRQGQYSVDAKGGVPVGTHRVEIEAFQRDSQASPKEEVPGVQGPPVKQYLPEKYNRTSQLTITVKPGSGPVKQDFSLEK